MVLTSSEISVRKQREGRAFDFAGSHVTFFIKPESRFDFYAHQMQGGGWAAVMAFDGNQVSFQVENEDRARLATALRTLADKLESAPEREP